MKFFDKPEDGIDNYQPVANIPVALDIELLYVYKHDEDLTQTWTSYSAECYSCSQCDEFKYSAVIIPGRFLKTFVRLLNSYSAGSRFITHSYSTCCFNRIVFNFPPSTKYFGEKTTDELLDSLLGLRLARSQNSLCGIFFTGLASDATLELQRSLLPPLSRNKSMEEAQSLREQGNSLAKNGQYTRAREAYILAIVMLYQWEYPCIFQKKRMFSEYPYRQLPVDHFATLLSVYSSLEMVSAKLNLSHESKQLFKTIRDMIREFCGLYLGYGSTYIQQEAIFLIIHLQTIQ